MRKEHEQFFKGLPQGFVEEHKHRIRHMEFFVDQEEFDRHQQEKGYQINWLNGIPYVFVEPLDDKGEPTLIEREIIVDVKIENAPPGVESSIPQKMVQRLKRRIVNPHGKAYDPEGYLGFEKMSVDEYKEKFMGQKPIPKKEEPAIDENEPEPVRRGRGRPRTNDT